MPEPVVRTTARSRFYEDRRLPALHLLSPRPQMREKSVYLRKQAERERKLRSRFRKSAFVQKVFVGALSLLKIPSEPEFERLRELLSN